MPIFPSTSGSSVISSPVITGSGAAGMPFVSDGISGSFNYTLTSGYGALIPYGVTNVKNLVFSLDTAVPMGMTLIVKLYYQTVVGGSLTELSGISVTIPAGDRNGNTTSSVAIPAGAKCIVPVFDPGGSVYSGVIKVIWSYT